MNATLSIIFAILSSVCAALGQIGLKFGSMRLTKKMSELMENYALLTGLVFYGLSTILFVIALRGYQLTVLYPIASLNYVFVNLLSIKYLDEKMNKYKWAGVLLVIIGITVIVL
jgi:undecaprenyl phosphate-alpha-L-ara4N flippase subunit ArnE